MKTVISSKYLARELKKIRFASGEYVCSVEIKDKLFLIITNIKTIELDAYYSEDCEKLNQYGARWDWVRDLVVKIDEQPIILLMYEGKVSIILNY